jgi:hypothetical protein
MIHYFVKLRRLAVAAMLFAGAATLPAFAQNGSPEAVGTFHGQVHETNGKVAVYDGTNSEKTLRITEFKTSNGPDVHVILIAADDAKDNENFLDKKVDRVELGKLKGNVGDQNYTIPAGTDLTKFKTVVIYCERFNATFGAAPLEKF